MESAWRVIDCIDVEGQLRYERGRMVVCADGKEPVAVPLAQTAVLLLGLRANISTALLFRLAQEGVSALFCDWRGVPTGALDSWGSTPSRVTIRHWAQVDMSVPRQKNAWKRIVKAKIRGQARCLEMCGRQRSGALLEMSNHVKTGDATNVEGMAAREYWKNLFDSDEGFCRMPGSGIGRNALLDYGYAVLRGFVIRSILAAGLDPTFGVNHHNRANYFCLADDLIEPYRPVVDCCVAQMDASAELDRDTKRLIVEAVNGRFSGDGLTVPSSLSDFAQQYGLYCEGQCEVLRVPVFGTDHEEG